MQCSDGQYVSILRAWNGGQYVCLPEVWRKYFPEVNRNNLTGVLKKLELDTHLPTGQQATLLRSAGVISLRYVRGVFSLNLYGGHLTKVCMDLYMGEGSPHQHLYGSRS